MSQDSNYSMLSRRDVEDILAVTRALAAPFELSAMLAEVTAAARRVLDAERSSVWLHDAATHELVLKVATELDNVRIADTTGLLGACVRDRVAINVPDCYADPRFDRGLDAQTGFHTRCSLTVPLVDHEGTLVGAMQILNKHTGVFEDQDVALAQALAAQCAVALSRARFMEATVHAQKMQKELELARVVQLSTMPASMPQVPGYDVFGSFRSADLTGGDTFDLALVEGGLLVLLADATGHGIAPALDVTRMHAMLRMALRLEAPLEAGVMQVNNELERSLPGDRFITAFMGLLDASAHRIRYDSAGQAPLLLYRAAEDDFEWMGPSGLPLAAMPMKAPRPLAEKDMRPGDVLVVLSDGIYEYESIGGEWFGKDRVAELIREQATASAEGICLALQETVAKFAGGAAQEDDMTFVIVRRSAGGIAARSFAPALASLQDIVTFTDDFAREHSVDAGVLQKVHFGIEELFTNIPKYNAGSGQPVRILLACVEGGMEVSICASDVDRFDPRDRPEVDVTLPASQRTPGGLGLHLIAKLMERVDYRYDEALRRGTTAFLATTRGAQASSSK